MKALERKQLERIAAATDENGYGVYADGVQAKSLEAAGYIEINRTDEVPGSDFSKGKYAQRITDAGRAALSGDAPVDTPDTTGNVAPVATAAPVAAPNEQRKEKPMFAIQDNVAIPARTSTKSEVYPFSQLGLKQSFFVPHKRNDDGELVRAISASTISSANKRGAENGRRFLGRVVTEGEGENAVTGVRVWRVEPETAEAEGSAE